MVDQMCTNMEAINSQQLQHTSFEMMYLDITATLAFRTDWLVGFILLALADSGAYKSGVQLTIHKHSNAALPFLRMIMKATEAAYFALKWCEH